jgi:hypothetical protein
MKFHKMPTTLLLLASLGWLSPVSAFDLGGLGEKLKKVEETVEKVDKKVETVKHETRFIRGDVSASEERQIGRDLAATLVHAAPPVNNARVQRYINRVGRWVAEHSERADLQWTRHRLDQRLCSAGRLCIYHPAIVSVAGKRGPAGGGAGP